MRKVYCKKHGDVTGLDFKLTLERVEDGELIGKLISSRDYCLLCIQEFLEIHITQVKIKEDLENEKTES